MARITPPRLARQVLAGCISITVLAGCGGGSDATHGASGSAAPAASAPPRLASHLTSFEPVPQSESGTSPGPSQEHSVSASLQSSQAQIVSSHAAPIGSTLTTLQVVGKAAMAQANVPVTFGQVFAKGALPAGTGLVGVYNGATLPLQVNVKATHLDGSVRHAVISVILPQVAVGQTTPLALNAAPASAPTPLVNPSPLLGNFDSTVKLTVGGQVYTASTSPLFRAGTYQSWLSGAVANEWLLTTPLKTAANVAHPHLAARFAIRHYSGGKVRVDVTVENNWAYEPDPKNLTYDAQVLVNGRPVYTNLAMPHYHHARWRKIFWAGDEPQLHIKHDSRYLIASKAVPNYDQSLTIAPATLTAMKTRWDKANTGPMGMAMVNHAMPATGGREEIGLNHAWGVMYLLSMDERAKEVTVGLSNLSGSWPVHYRDRTTGEPVSIQHYPYARTQRIGGDSYNPVTKKHEDLPACNRVDPMACDKIPKQNCVVSATESCTVQYLPDTSHHPSFGYLPYLVTGDAYHLDELMFWANWNLLKQNPGYRGYAKGTVASEQVRGQAWALRSLGQAAYITPDKHPLKGYFNQIVNNNLELYHTKFVVGNPNQLGFNDSGYAVGYGWGTNSRVGVAPWQDDFFTSAVGHLVELDFPKAAPLLAWKSKFPVGRMTAPGICWVDGASYQFAVRPSATAPYFNTFAEAYKATMLTNAGGVMVNSTGKRYLDQPCASQAQADWRTQNDIDQKLRRNPWLVGEMTGYPSSTAGYPANMQPALAYAAGTDIANAKTAWAVFMKRSVKPAYGTGPQFAIVPR